MVDGYGFHISGNWADCGPDCPMHPNPNIWMTDDTLKVTHHDDQNLIMIALKLYGIMSTSLALIALLVTFLGMKL